ncbi:probable inactive receptor kinase At1g48480 [Dendrobium catenatum]|uniref:Putative inactive receptor kinase n=1 Tax=Dendrobium catenatum TaxID=906689 RepID=A0A2I0WJ83_9ASPA|nr:probable inactive receptor kinase At1g48480 [Dendrobium catenatum]PKU75723.1 putative inactive receptor kinase [Dendrobium catenatum]
MNCGHLPMDTRLLLLLLFLFLLTFSPAVADLAGDGAALMTFRAAVGRFVLPWNTSVSPCMWPGVTCASNRVVSLRLPGSGLIGQIPEGTLGNLSNLQTLSLRFNALSGPLPSDLARCKELRNLYLQGNRFSGEIPAFLSSLSSLVRLNLAENNFSGVIPLAFNNLTRLGTLYLESNHLSGEIPELDLPNLVQFNVSFNRLNGSVPSKLRDKPANSFLGMSLCGGPLGLCPGEISPAAAPTGTLPSGSGSKLSGAAIAGIVIGTIAVFLILLVILFLLCRKKGKAGAAKSVEAKPPEVEVALRDVGIVDGVGTNGGAPATKVAASSAPAAALAAKKQLAFFGNGPKVYDLEDLLRASAEVLGKGTFGTTYKAVLETGMMVAVKRLRDANTPEKEFREKIDAIGAMNHPNLVPLQAYYHSKDEKLLVYDYMPMGSLSSLLHGNRGSGRTPLSWEIRTSIAMAAARGIEYIHSTSHTASHGNIKSSNILLTSSSEARVSDHGLAHLVGLSATSNRAAGYRAPEVTDTRRVSQKADVYSFGVLLLELLTGKAPAQALLNEEGVDLPRWVQSVVHEEWTSEVFDMELLRYQSVEEEMAELLQLGVNCTAQYPDQRPTMSMVVAKIEELQRSSVEVSKE